MDFNFLPPKPPDISFINSPAAYVTVNEDSDSSLIDNLHDSNSIKNKKKKRHSNKRHRSDCSKNKLEDIVIPLEQTSQPQSLSFTQPNLPSSSLININNETNFYNANDSGPFVVHVQRKIFADSFINNDSSKSNSDEINNLVLNPIVFGKFMQKKSFSGILPGSIIRIGRNRIKISFRSFKDANNFVENITLRDNGYNAFIPSFCTSKMGVIKVPIDVSIEDIIADSTIPNKPIKIIKARRLNYKSTENNVTVWKPSQSVVLTIEGQILPEFVFLYYNKLNITLYHYPTIQCFSCCRFGHTKNNCRSKPRCFKCGQNHIGASCTIEESDACCLLCSGNHLAISRNCPEYNRQQNIKSIMSQKSISYLEADKLEPRIIKSYADVSKNTSYKKTIFIKPKSRKNSVSKEFDKEFHNKILKDVYVPNADNGCALNKNDNVNSSQITLTSVLLSLLDLIKQNEPYNAELILNNLISSTNNVSNPNKNNTVELPKH